MQKDFSKKWIFSTQKRKQRKYRHNAPLNIKKNFVKSHLSKDLRQKYGVRSLIVRKGDTVKVMVGDHKGKEAKVQFVSHKHSKVFLENIQMNKKDGSKRNVSFDASNLMIVSLNLEDKKRIKFVERKKTKSKVIPNIEKTVKTEKIVKQKSK